MIDQPPTKSKDGLLSLRFACEICFEDCPHFMIFLLLVKVPNAYAMLE
jgi:hypothetical protein